MPYRWKIRTAVLGLLVVIWGASGCDKPPEWKTQKTDLDMARVAHPYSEVLEAYDPNPRDKLTYESKGDKPDWLELDPDGDLSGTPGTEALAEGEYTFAVVVKDSKGHEELGTFTVQVGENRPPEFRSYDDMPVTVGRPFSIELVADDPDGDEVEYECTDCPPWLTPKRMEDRRALQLSGTPPSPDTWTVKVTARDELEVYTTDYREKEEFEGFEKSTLLSFRLIGEGEVLNRPPRFASSYRDRTITAGERFSMDLVAEDPDREAIKIECTNCPRWLQGAQSGNKLSLSGTPSGPGEWRITVRVHDRLDEPELRSANTVSFLLTVKAVKEIQRVEPCIEEVRLNLRDGELSGAFAALKKCPREHQRNLIAQVQNAFLSAAEKTSEWRTALNRLGELESVDALAREIGVGGSDSGRIGRVKGRAYIRGGQAVQESTPREAVGHFTTAEQYERYLTNGDQSLWQQSRFDLGVCYARLSNIEGALSAFGTVPERPDAALYDRAQRLLEGAEVTITVYIGTQSRRLIASSDDVGSLSAEYWQPDVPESAGQEPFGSNPLRIRLRPGTWQFRVYDRGSGGEERFEEASQDTFQVSCSAWIEERSVQLDRVLRVSRFLWFAIDPPGASLRIDGEIHNPEDPYIVEGNQLLEVRARRDGYEEFRGSVRTYRASASEERTVFIHLIEIQEWHMCMRGIEEYTTLEKYDDAIRRLSAIQDSRWGLPVYHHAMAVYQKSRDRDGTLAVLEDGLADASNFRDGPLIKAMLYGFKAQLLLDIEPAHARTAAEYAQVAYEQERALFEVSRMNFPYVEDEWFLRIEAVRRLAEAQALIPRLMASSTVSEAMNNQVRTAWAALLSCTLPPSDQAFRSFWQQRLSDLRQGAQERGISLGF